MIADSFFSRSVQQGVSLQETIWSTSSFQGVLFLKFHCPDEAFYGQDKINLEDGGIQRLSERVKRGRAVVIPVIEETSTDLC